MDKMQVLQKLLNGTESEEEIQLLRKLLSSGEISISGNVNHSVIIIGNGNTVELSPEALERLSSIQLPLDPNKIEKLTNQYLSKVEKEWSTLHGDQSGTYAYSSSESADNVPLTNIYGLFQPLYKSKEGQGEKADSVSSSRSVAVGKTDIPAPIHLSEMLAKERHLLLLGEPGAGKTTVLQFIGLCFARKGWAKDRLELEEHLIPIRLVIRQHTDMLSRPDPSLEKVLAVSINKFLRLPNSSEAENLLNEWLKQKKPLLVLLDGLDEIPEKLRIQVAEEVRIFTNSYGANCRIILSSRPIDRVALGGNFRSYVFKPFERSEDALPYLEAWLNVLEKNVRDAASLLETLNSQTGLKRITNNPLLLRLAAEVYQSDKPFIRNRAELYREYVEQITWKRRGLAIPPDEKRVALDTLESLAWQLQSGEATSIPENLPLLREQLGLVEPWQEYDKMSLRFSHQTFQEYFVARRLKKEWTEGNSRENTWLLIKSQMHDQDWREPLLLLIGMLDTDLAADLIYRVLRSHSPYEKKLFRDLYLAAQLAGERTDLPKRLVKEIVERLVKKLVSISIPMSLYNNNHSWWRRSKAKEALEKIGSQAMETLIKINRGRLWLIRPVDKHHATTFSMVYQKIIDYRPSRTNWFYLVWEEIEVSIKTPVEALSESMHDATLSALLPYITHKDIAFRLLAIASLRHKRSEQSIPVLLQALEDINENVRQAAAEALGEIGNLKAAQGLRKLLVDPDEDVHIAALNALANVGDSYVIDEWARRVHEDGGYPFQNPALVALKKIGAPAIPALDKIVEEHRGEGLGFEAVRILSGMLDIRTIPILLKILYAPEWSDERHEIFRNLVNIGPDAIPILLNALKDNDAVVRTAAIAILGEIGNDQIAPDLLKMLEDPEKIVRRKVARVLGNIDDVRVVPSLIKAMEANLAQINDRGWEQNPFQISLKEIGLTAIPFLMDTLHSPNMEMRRLVVQTLGEIHSSNVVPELLAAYEQLDIDEINFEPQYVGSTIIRTTPLDVRLAIIEALGEIGDLRAVPFLLAELLSKHEWNEYMRGQSAEALGKIGDLGSIPDLIQIAQNTTEDDYVRISSINALGDIGDEQAIPVLLQVLKESDTKIRAAAYKALGEIGDQKVLPDLQQISFTKGLGLSDEEIFRALFKTGGVEVKIFGKHWYELDSLRVAEYGLQYLGAFAIPGFLKVLLLVDPTNDFSWIIGAEKILEKIGEDAIPTLQNLLHDQDERIRKLATGLLSKIGIPAIHALVDATTNEDVNVRWVAVRALSEIGDPQTAYAMYGLLFDPEIEIKWLAAIALGKLGVEKEQKEQVVSILLNIQPESRFAYYDETKTAIAILGNLGDEKVLPFLLGYPQWQERFPLNKKLSTNRLEAARLAAITSFANIRSLFTNLRDRDSDLDESMIKISGRVKKENANALKSVVRFFYRQHDWGKLEVVVGRIEKLQKKTSALL